MADNDSNKNTTKKLSLEQIIHLKLKNSISHSIKCPFCDTSIYNISGKVFNSSNSEFEDEFIQKLTIPCLECQGIIWHKSCYTEWLQIKKTNACQQCSRPMFLYSPYSNLFEHFKMLIENQRTSKQKYQNLQFICFPVICVFIILIIMIFGLIFKRIAITENNTTFTSFVNKYSTENFTMDGICFLFRTQDQILWSFNDNLNTWCMNNPIIFNETLFKGDSLSSTDFTFLKIKPGIIGPFLTKIDWIILMVFSISFILLYVLLQINYTKRCKQKCSLISKNKRNRLGTKIYQSIYKKKQKGSELNNLTKNNEDKEDEEEEKVNHKKTKKTDDESEDSIELTSLHDVKVSSKKTPQISTIKLLKAINAIEQDPRIRNADIIVTKTDIIESDQEDIDLSEPSIISKKSNSLEDKEDNSDENNESDESLVL